MLSKNGVPKGSRTPVTAVKGRCPGPLDDGDSDTQNPVILRPVGKKSTLGQYIHAKIIENFKALTY